jgi:hypothetical protein
MTEQHDLFEAACVRRELGIEHARVRAEHAFPGWTVYAALWMTRYLQRSGPAMIEDVRRASRHDPAFPQAPNDKAWGGVVRYAVARGWVRRARGIGRAKCSNLALRARWEAGAIDPP